MIDTKKYIWPGKKHDDPEVTSWAKESNEFTCELDKLSQKYNCDKSNVQVMSFSNNNVPRDWTLQDPLKICGHNYVEIYDMYFSKKRFDKLKILEIGMGNHPTNGFSLRMWLDYFPNSEIHIIDNQESNFRCDFEYDTNRVKFYIVDQSSPEQLDGFSNHFKDGYFDLIIDDGSHIASHQILTFKYLFHLLKKEETYFIEDIHDDRSVDYMVDLFKYLNHGMISDTSFMDNINDLEISNINLYRSLIAIKRGVKITR